MRNLSVNTIVIATMALALVFAGPGTAEAGVCKEVGRKSGCVNTKDVKNNNLTAADQLDEAGADFVAQNNNVALTGAPQVIASVQVTAPGSGVVIANASGWFDMGPAAKAVQCALSQDANFPAFPRIIEDHGGSDGDDDEAFALTRGFPVSAGTITVNLVCLDFSGNTGAAVADVALTAMYFPTRY